MSRTRLSRHAGRRVMPRGCPSRHRFAAFIVTAVVAVVVGECSSALFFGGAALWSKVLTTAVVLTVVAVNVTGARFVDRVRNTVVVVLLSVVAIFLVVAMARLHMVR